MFLLRLSIGPTISFDKNRSTQYLANYHYLFMTNLTDIDTCRYYRSPWLLLSKTNSKILKNEEGDFL